MIGNIFLIIIVLLNENFYILELKCQSPALLKFLSLKNKIWNIRARQSFFFLNLQERVDK